MPEIGIALAVRGDAQEQRRMATLQRRRRALQIGFFALFTLTEDAKEGQAAFQQKRKPEWKGQ